MRRGFILAFGASLLAAAALACGLEDGGTLDGLEDGHDASTTVDASVTDGTTPDDHTSPPSDGSSPADAATDPDAAVDSGPATSYSCSGSPVTDCRTDCPSAPYECGPTKTCVASCFVGCGLSGAPSECNACGADGGLARSICEPPANAGACLGSSPGLQRCTCGASSAGCTSDFDTCISGKCYECNDPDASTSGQVCKGGTGAKKCDTGGGATNGYCH